MTDFHGGSEAVWGAIARLNNGKRQITAAIAWVTDDTILKFRSGDTLITDLSPTSVRNRTASPELISQLPKGVRVFSLPGLHAKTALIGTTLIVGSMNASDSSRNSLVEGAIETQDQGARAKAMSWLKRLEEEATLITPAALKNLLAIPRSDRKRWPQSKAKSIPETGSARARPHHRLYFASYRDLDNEMAKRADKKVERFKKQDRFRDVILDYVQYSSRGNPTPTIGDRVILAMSTKPNNGGILVARPGTVWDIDRDHGLINVHLYWPKDAPRSAVTWNDFKKLARNCGIYGLTRWVERRLPADACRRLAIMWPARGLDWYG